MSMDPALHEVVERARQRLWVRAWGQRLKRVAPVLLAVAAAVVALRVTGFAVHWAWVAAVPVVIAAVAWWSHRHRPAPAAAAAIWDHAAGRADEVLNAWWFSAMPNAAGGALTVSNAQRSSGAAAATHIHRVISWLPVWRGSLASDLPLRHPWQGWAAPMVLAAVVVAVGVNPPQPAPLRMLDSGAQARLQKELVAVRAALNAIPTDQLSAEEKTQLDRLQQDLDHASKSPDALNEQDALEKLDALAKQAEKLAAKSELGKIADAKLLAELARLPDLAALGKAIDIGDLAKAAQLSAELAKRLSDPQTSLEELRRLGEALSRSASAAAAAGDQSDLAKALMAADAALDKGDRTAAGAALEQLGQQLAKAAARQKDAARLAELAARLRGAGANALDQAGAMARLDPAAGMADFAPDLQPFQQPGRAGKSGEPRPGKPRTLRAPRDPKGDGNNNVPLPGQAEGDNEGDRPGIDGDGEGDGDGDGEGQGDGDGESGDAGMDGDGFANGDAPLPGEGMGLGLALSNQPGEGIGQGHVDSSQDPTTPTAPTTTSTVKTAVAKGAPGQRRLIMNPDRHEGAAVAASESPGAILAGEEQALESDALPAARRDQVRAYFNLVRQTLDQPAPSAPRAPAANVVPGTAVVPGAAVIPGAAAPNRP